MNEPVDKLLARLQEVNIVTATSRGSAGAVRWT